MDKRLNQTGRVMYRESIGCHARDCLLTQIHGKAFRAQLFFCGVAFS